MNSSTRPQSLRTIVPRADRRTALASSVVLWALASANPLAASPVAGKGDNATSEPATSGVTPATMPLAWKVWPLFDPFVSRRENAYSGGIDKVTGLRESEPWRRYSFGFSETMTTLRSLGWVSVARDFTFHVGEPSSYSFDFSTYRYAAGLRLPGFELGPGVSLVPISVDYTQGHFGLSGLSPAATAQASLKLGKVRIELFAYEQFTWRWLGRDSEWASGLMLRLALEQPRTLRRAEHPLLLQY